MKRLLLLSSLLLPLSLFAEKSAFGAGDLDSPSPYGLTATEKHILKNKDTVRKNKSRLDSVEESLSGMLSVVEGLNEKAQSDKMELQGLKDSSKTLNEKVDALVLKHDENINQLKVVMGELSSLIDTINTNYVSKEEYNKLAKEINSFKLDVAKQLKKIARAGSNTLDNKSNAQVAKDAQKLFNDKKYADAIDSYEHLITKNYKPAAAHFYIGESYFQLDEYANAISYFKESAERYSKAKYMPKLMLHTAIAFQKTKDNEHAQQFLQALIAKYPNSDEAQQAQKLLK